MPKASLNFKDIDLKDLTGKIGAKNPFLYNLYATDTHELMTDMIIEKLLEDEEVSSFIEDRLAKINEREFLRNFKPLDSSEKLIGGLLIAAAKEAIDREEAKNNKKPES